MAMTGPSTPSDLFTLERAYRAPRDPLMTPANPEIIYRDIPAAFQPTWDIASVQSALANHLAGMFVGSSLLTDALLGDPRVQATLTTRTSALYGKQVRFRGAEADKDGRCLETWQNAWRRIGPTSVLSEMSRSDVMMGFSPAQLLWDTSDPIWVPIIRQWNTQFAYYDQVGREYIAITYDGLLPIVPGDGKWMLSTPHGAYRGWMHGAVRAVAQPWLTRAFALRDWARYSEIHGIPIVKAKVPAMGDAIQKQRFQASLRNLGSESVVMLPQGIDGILASYDLDLLEARDNSWQAFLGLVVQCDVSIILAILGQNLTTEIKEGSNAAASEHGDVKQKVTEWDNNTRALSIYRDVARPFAAFNFGDPEKAPYTYWDIEPEAERYDRAKTLQAVAVACFDLSRAGVKFNPLEILKPYRIQGIPEQESPIMPAPAAAPGSTTGPSEPGDKKESAPA